MMILHKTISKRSADSEQSMLDLLFCFHRFLAPVANLTFAAEAAVQCATLTKQNCSRPCAGMPLRRNARVLAQVCPCAGYVCFCIYEPLLHLRFLVGASEPHAPLPRFSGSFVSLYNRSPSLMSLLLRKTWNLDPAAM